ncbi:MAG: ATP-binding protein [Acidobacteriota bacterium]
MDFLVNRLGRDPASDRLQTRLKALHEQSEAEQRHRLPALYIQAERYLADLAPECVDAEELRREVRERFPDLRERRTFRILFAPSAEQEILLSERLLEIVIHRACELLESDGGSDFPDALLWLRTPPRERRSLPLGLGDPGRLAKIQFGGSLLRRTDSQNLALAPEERLRLAELMAISERSQRLLDSRLGSAQTQNVYEAAFRRLSRSFRHLDALSVCVQLLPDALLDDDKIALLSQRQMRSVLLEKIDALEQARRRSEAAERAKSSLLQNLTHELRSPVHAILGLGNVLLDGESSESKRGHLGSLLSSGEGLLLLIDDLLEVSRGDAERSELATGPVDLRACAATVLDGLRQRATDRGLELRLETSPGSPPWALADETRLRQVLVHLVDNGIKFTDTGSITLRLEGPAHPAAEGGPVRLRILDTGVGIPQDQIPRIFEPFEQAQDLSTRAREGGGAGLGLSISRQLVKAMGGELRVRSAPGEGSEFFFTLPQAAAAVGQAPDRKSTDDSPSSAVLVVDDHPVNRQVARAQLERLGYSPCEADGGRRALEELRRRRFDAVLLDIQMPELDGFEICRRIRESPERYGAPKILMLSAGLSALDQRRCRELGADGEVIKPVSLHALATALNQSLGTGASPRHQTDVDLTRLEKMRSIFSDHRWREILESFTEANGKILAQMQQALAAADVEALIRLARRMRSSAAGMGATRIAALCVDIESTGGSRSARPANLDGLEERLLQLEEAWSSFSASANAIAPAP